MRVYLSETTPTSGLISMQDAVNTSPAARAVLAVLHYYQKHGMIREWYTRNHKPLPPWELRRIMERTASWTPEEVTRVLAARGGIPHDPPGPWEELNTAMRQALANQLDREQR